MCTRVKVLKSKTLERQERKRLDAKLAEHLEEVRQERLKYWHHRSKAKRSTKDYLSIIIDGMDQQKTLLPYFKMHTALTEKQRRLKVHVVGVIVHGRGTFTFITTERLPSDPNLVVHCITRALTKLREEGPLPKTLYIQADNTSRENKNKTVFAWAGYAVQNGWFEKVKKK